MRRDLENSEAQFLKNQILNFEKETLPRNPLIQLDFNLLISGDFQGSDRLRSHYIPKQRMKHLLEYRREANTWLTR